MLRILVVMNATVALWVSKMDSGVARCLSSWMCLFLPFIRESSVQLLSRVWLFATPQTAACQASLSITNSRTNSCSLSRWCHTTISSSVVSFPLPPSIFPSIRVFSNESALLIRCPKYWGFSFSISPSNEYSGLISFRMDWLDLLAAQGTLKSLLQHHSSKASIFGTQLSL